MDSIILDNLHQNIHIVQQQELQQGGYIFRGVFTIRFRDINKDFILTPEGRASFLCMIRNTREMLLEKLDIQNNKYYIYTTTKIDKVDNSTCTLCFLFDLYTRSE